MNQVENCLQKINLLCDVFNIEKKIKDIRSNGYEHLVLIPFKNFKKIFSTMLQFTYLETSGIFVACRLEQSLDLNDLCSSNSS